jgi:hypothetical protein
MTSPSRRKRQTTPPNSRRKNSRESRVEGREPEPAISNLQSLLRAGIIGALVTTAITANATASELKWRSARKVSNASPSTSSEDRGHVQLTSGTDGLAQFKSVVIQREDRYRGFRSAQLPSTGSSIESESQSAEDLQGPGVPMPDELPPLDDSQAEDLDFDMPPQPQDEMLQFDQNQRQQQNERQPIEGRPLQPAPLDTTMPPGPLPERIPAPSVDAMEAEREKSDEACTQGLSDLQNKTIVTLDIAIAVTGDEGSDYPFECALDEGRWHEGRCWEQTTYLWKASALCHKPLFFEDEQLERYGHSWSPCCQPLISSAHFFTRLPILPYCMGVEPPNECIYALGHYRPGSCAPYMCSPVPLSCRGAMFQAGAVVGAAAVLP